MGHHTVQRFSDAATLASTAARDLVIELANRPRDGACTVALSGGRIARTFLTALARLSADQPGLFDRVHFFWGDERCVPPDHAESNYGLARECFFDKVAAHGCVHRIRGEIAPDAAAREAAAELRQVAPEHAPNQPVLDFVFLGMGEDGHIASLFPGENEASMTDLAAYRPVRASKPPPERITIGYPALAVARVVRVLVSGPDKARTLLQSLRGDADTPMARLIRLRATTEVLTDCPLPP